MSPKAKAELNPALMRELQQTRCLQDCEYWRSLCPWLSVEGETMYEIYDTGPLEAEEVEERKERMRRDGFYIVRGTDWGFDIQLLEEGVKQLLLHGWQATFITMYDEAWGLPYKLRELINETTGDSGKSFNFDFLGYHVSPPSEAGMPPHRDFPHCPPESWCATDQDLPRVVSCWIALSDVDAFNSCLYMLPACKDAKYRSGKSESAEELFTTNESFQDIVALPMDAGDFVVFSHRVYHWGSSSTACASHPRVALALGFSDPSFKPPYLVEPEPFPSCPIRLALNTAQMIIYNKRDVGPWPLTSDKPSDLAFLASLYRMLRPVFSCLDGVYRNTIESSPILGHL